MSDGIAMVKVSLGLPGMDVLEVIEGDNELVVKVERPRRSAGARRVGFVLSRRTEPSVRCVICRTSDELNLDKDFGSILVVPVPKPRTFSLATSELHAIERRLHKWHSTRTPRLEPHLQSLTLRPRRRCSEKGSGIRRGRVGNSGERDHHHARAPR